MNSPDVTPHPHVTIRTLQECDLLALVALCREHAWFERARWRELDRERASRLGRLLIASPLAFCWVAEAAEHLVGFASCGLELSTWDACHNLHLDCLYLQPAYRGSGIGRSLMRRAAKQAVILGAASLQWQTPHWNTRAARFYGRMGATEQAKRRFTLDRDACERLVRSGRR